MEKRIFVSHISEEADIAAFLTQKLERDFLGLVRFFTSSDGSSIKLGDQWLTDIKKAMDTAVAVIVLCSKASIHRPWVQFELGAAWMKGIPVLPICHSGLAPTELPMPLYSLQAVQLGTEQGIKSLYQSIASRLSIPGSPLPSDLGPLLKEIKAREKKYGSRTHQYERYIDIVVAPGQQIDKCIPDDTKIESDEDSLALFRLAEAAGWTWKDIVNSVWSGRVQEARPDTRWMTQLHQCILLASQNKLFDPVQAIYHGERASYQPQLAKKENLPDGSCRFHIHFVETVVAPLRDVQNDFGLLATMLRLGLRFRYEVIEKFKRLVRTGRVPQGGIESLIQQLRSAVEVIENDARSRGTENFDTESVAALFESEPDQEEIRSLQVIWDESRLLLFRSDPPPVLQEIHSALSGMHEVNYRFMCLATERYHHMVCNRWRLGQFAQAGDPESALLAAARKPGRQPPATPAISP
jgi:hypothetical protein